MKQSCGYLFKWLQVFGLDKATLEDRHQWVSENHELITKVATDPVRYLSDWEEVDEPWQFMAACHEYYHCCIKKR